MFGSKDKGLRRDKPTGTVLAEGITIKGSEMAGNGDVRIDGVFFGNIDVDGLLIVGESGSIKGDIVSKDAHVEGAVEGNVTTSNQVHIRPSGSIYGNIKCISLIVDEMASFRGLCEMGSRPKPQEV